MEEIETIIEDLKQHQHRDSTKRNYYAIWKTFNKFFIRLDCKPTTWEDRLTLFVGHLVHQNKKASTVKSYISAIRSVLFEVNVELQEDKTLLMALTKACKLRNDTIKIRLPIQRGMLAILMNQLNIIYDSQPYLRVLYRAMLITVYFGLFRISEVGEGSYFVLAKDVHIGRNKKKMLFVLRSSKTHGRHMDPQIIKISSHKGKVINEQECNKIELPCLYELLRICVKYRGGYRSETKLLFKLSNGKPVKPSQFNFNLKMFIKFPGFDEKLYSSHSLRAGRSCDLFKLGLSVETIKKIDRWRSNSVYQYLKM